MKDRERKIVVVTGATRGIGRAISEKLLALGHAVAGCGRSRNQVDQLRHQYPDAIFDVVDVTEGPAVDEWAQKIVEKLGSPDLLINNAALINRSAPLWEIEREEFDRVVDVNIKGVANGIRSFLPSMLERGEGVLVNLSSGWGRSTSPEVAPYCATKWAIEGLTKSLAQELPQGMAAIPVSPGMVHTEMLESCWGEEANNHRLPAEWAQKAVPFLLQLGPKDNGESLTTG